MNGLTVQSGALFHFRQSKEAGDLDQGVGFVVRNEERIPARQ
jgi:hypothetical protein